MSNNTFSALERPTLIQNLTNKEYDLLIIGGGITGAGIALDAATRGLKTALIEKVDFAWGTSSRSTKLIHGGLRYLKQFEIALVREVGRERAIVHRNARHLVIPEKMLLPIVEGGSLNAPMSSIGLWVYDFLAGVEKDERRKMLGKDKIAELEPMLRKDILKGGGLYYEYRSDDARLTIENLKTAVRHGADCANYVAATDYIYENNRVVGAKVTDELTNQEFTIKAKVVINATGPWVDDLRAKDHEVKGKRLHLTKGVHLVFPYEKLPLKQSVYFDILEDGRMAFAIPRGRITYVGTTDTDYKANIDRPVTTAEDVEYIIKATNNMFPEVELTSKDVISTWAGLRPLIHEDGKDPSELSRKDEIFLSETGLISIAGGKLTGYRKMAERVLNTAIKQLKVDFPNQFDSLKVCHTASMKLLGGNFDSQKELYNFITKRIGEAKQIKATPEQVVDLVYKYGTETDAIIEKAYELYNKILDANERLHVAELWYSIHSEMTMNLRDYLIRRTGRLYFERDHLARWYPIIAKHMAAILGWSEEQKLRELAAFKEEYEEVVEFQHNIVA